MKLGVIIAILIVVYQVVTLIVKAAGKQQEERMRAGGGGAQGRTPPGGVRRPTATPTRQADLEARRQAQLQQLRMRREARQSGGATQARLGSGQTAPRPLRPTPTPPPPPSRPAQVRPPAAPPPVAVRTGGPSLIDRRRQRLEELRARRATQEAEEARLRRAAMERARREAADRQREATAKARREALRKAEPMVSPKEIAALDLTALYRRLRDPAALREAIVLKEILEPPIALREPPALQ